MITNILTILVSKQISTPKFRRKTVFRYISTSFQEILFFMKKMLTPSEAQKAHALATWYRALALHERTIPHLQKQITPSLSNSELAHKRLQRWKEQIAFKQEGLFTERLALDELAEEDLFTLLAEPTEALQERIPTYLPWLEELLQAFTDTQSEEDVALPLPQAGFDPHHIALLTILKPLLHNGVRRIQTTIQALQATYTRLPFDPERILPLLLISIVEQLISLFIKTAVLELNVARVEGRLHGATSEERFQDFVQQVVQQKGIPPLLEEYAVLTRQLVESIDNWVIREQELLTRLCTDWQQICSTFTPEQHPGQLIEIHEGVGDTHRGGRSVTILTWNSRFRLVYKPHSLAIDTHFQELLVWLNEHGQQPPLRTFTVLNKDAYGWAEFLRAAPCTSPTEVERFYERQGSYLALLYALEAVDFHAENVIAMGEHPMLVDLESLFHPLLNISDEEKFALPALETIGRSVQRIGLLPQRIWGSGDIEGIDISGLGGQPGQLTPEPVSRWVEIGTDQMRLTNERIELTPSKNRPTLDGHEINTLDYSASINAGFGATYRLLIHVRTALLTEILPRFASDEIRCLLRPTRLYAQLQTDSLHPNVLRDALDRDCLLDRLWIGIEHQPHLQKIIRAEQADLRQRDIPLFTTHVDAHDLYTCNGETITAFFAESGLELVTRRIQQLDEEDLERQSWIIQASFTSMILGTDQAAHKILHLQPSKNSVTQEQLLTAAQKIGDRLSKLALTNKETAGWLGVNAIKEREWRLTIAEEDLYSGASGIVLFLAYLSTVTAKEQYNTLARLGLKTIRHFVTQKKPYPHLSGIGTFSGIGSYIYLLSHLGTLWHEPALYVEAEEIVKLLPTIIAREKIFDVIGGSAGCIAALYSLYAVAPSDAILTCAGLCGDHLLACAQPMAKGIGWSLKDGEPPLAGFSHGTAGIALNLLRLFKLTQEQRFQQGARAAIDYERSLFSSKAQNWPDLRSDPASTSTTPAEDKKYMTAWCHGAAGIGLARLGGLDILDTPEIRKEITIAIQTTLRDGFGLNHSLCHGDLGNMDVLLTAAHVLKKAEYKQAIDRISAMLLDSIDRQGWVTGVPLSVETPGFMVGLSGIGYGLLRLATPEQVPSVLLGEAPSDKSDRRA
jgi:type 2 lantibiotic biosynthesis protein LanM